jgi:GTP-sensing pleiotropic transcriptional regulator CodY
MAVQSPSVLGPEDLNETDREILEELEEGRVTPALIADRRDLGRSYISQRLIRFEEHGHADELVRGLYELVDDPRKDSDE